MFVHWVLGVERVLVILHHGAKLYLRVTRDRRERGDPFEVRMSGPNSFMDRQDPSDPNLYHVRHKDQTLTLWIGYPSDKVKCFDRSAIMIRAEAGPQWIFRVVEPKDDDWPDWADYRPQPKPKDSGDDQQRDEAGRDRR
jgi:hypothetical protein